MSPLQLFLLFAVLPIAELALMIQVGTSIGTAWTIAICLVTAFVGSRLAQAQGRGVFARIEEQLRKGMMPTQEVVDAVLILVAGVVLLTPGFMTDAFGLLLLLPPTRAMLKPRLIGWFKARMAARSARTYGYGDGATAPSRESAGPDVEYLPPERAPRHPKPRDPAVIQVD